MAVHPSVPKAALQGGILLVLVGAVLFVMQPKALPPFPGQGSFSSAPKAKSLDELRAQYDLLQAPGESMEGNLLRGLLVSHSRDVVFEEYRLTFQSTFPTAPAP